MHREMVAPLHELDERQRQHEMRCEESRPWFTRPHGDPRTPGRGIAPTDDAILREVDDVFIGEIVEAVGGLEQ
jgi:hypothetical protein